jgi:steroid delta-isomerase-like uncharacterized protein
MAGSDSQFPYARYIDDVWNAHNPDALVNYVATDARVHSIVNPGDITGAGLDYLKQRASSLFKAFPDAKFVIEEVIQQDDRLAARVTLEGTQQSDFAGIAATGKRVKVYDFAMYRITDGKISDIWSLIDKQIMRDQLQGLPGFSATSDRR